MAGGSARAAPIGPPANSASPNVNPVRSQLAFAAVFQAQPFFGSSFWRRPARGDRGFKEWAECHLLFSSATAKISSCCSSDGRLDC